MLIAKVLDKLFNRRNTFEVESLEGDIGGISLQDCLDWVANIKDVITYDDEEGIITVDENTLFTGAILLSGIRALRNEDYDYLFASLTDQAGKCVVVNEDETGFEYQQKATVWLVEDFDELGSWLDENYSNLKVGDILQSDSWGGYVGIIEAMKSDYLKYSVLETGGRNLETYVYDNTVDGWVLSESTSTPIGFNQTYLTHSFDELDQTLQQIVEDAIADNWDVGVACTQAQWDAIKSLLDKSLYINYGGYSMIKSWTEGIHEYYFGSVIPNDVGYSLEFMYDIPTSKLCAKYTVV